MFRIVEFPENEEAPTPRMARRVKCGETSCARRQLAGTQRDRLRKAILRLGGAANPNAALPAWNAPALCPDAEALGGDIQRYVPLLVRLQVDNALAPADQALWRLVRFCWKRA
jgi:hypothetical protein